MNQYENKDKEKEYDEFDGENIPATDGYGEYITAIKKYTPLESNEIHRLGAILQGEVSASQDEVAAARDTLVKHHLMHVVSIAFQHLNMSYHSVDIMHLIQAGNIGLLKSLKTWDHNKGLLTTYSKWFIKHEILLLFPISVPETEKEKELELAKLDTKEAKEAKMKEWEKEFFRRRTEDYAVRMNDSYSEDSEGETMESFISDGSSSTPEEIFITKNTKLYKEDIPLLLENIGMDSEAIKVFLKKHAKLIQQMPSISKTCNNTSSNANCDLYDSLKKITSGDTTYLFNKQQHYDKLFLDLESSTDEPQVSLWNQNLLFRGNTFERKAFLKECHKISSIPIHRYFIRFLLQRYNIHIGKENENRLWEYMKRDDWKLNSADATLPNCDLNQIIFTTHICDGLLIHLYNLFQAEYQSQEVYLKTPSTYFNKLLRKGIGFHQFARVYHMDVETYLTFRKKALKLKEVNFMNRDFILTYLVLKYAAQCGVHNYEQAFLKLQELYPAVKLSAEQHSFSEISNTVVLEKEFLNNLEIDQKLAKDLCNKLFTERMENLSSLLQQQEQLRSLKAVRSYEEEFQYQWNNLITSVQTIEKKRFDNQKLRRFLYGSDYKTLSTKNLKTYSDTASSSFLQTEEFSNTFIDTNVLGHQFSKYDDESYMDKRNILLTVLFLNFTCKLLQDKKLKDFAYQNRIAYFTDYVTDSLDNCGFITLHSSIGYDTFLKLLLTCSDPLDMFRKIWKVKIRDTQKRMNKEHEY